MDKKEFEALEVGNMPIILAGTAATALAIIGLAGIIPWGAVAVSAIALGAALILVGLALGVEKKHILVETVGGRLEGPKLISAGIGMEVLIGVVSVVLGILALVHIAPQALELVAFLTIGVTLALKGSTLAARLTQEYHQVTA